MTKLARVANRSRNADQEEGEVPQRRTCAHVPLNDCPTAAREVSCLEDAVCPLAVLELPDCARQRFHPNRTRKFGQLGSMTWHNSFRGEQARDRA